ncbi:MAG TPA: hypothetical protein VGO00_05680, partial [Kofleriaceae bacterium]|nr:hypothetical protein [Kofleriaceae bacterium]
MARRHAFLLGCVLAAQAHASPRSDPTTGRAVFTGATMPSATSITLDPAAIGIGPVDEIYVAVAAVLDRIHIDRQSLALDGTLSDAGSLHATPIGPGGQLAVLWHFGRVTLGASFGSPPVAPYISNQDAIRYHILGGDLRDYVGAVAASFKVTDDFYFGVSAALDDIRLHLHYLRDTALDNGHGPRGVDSDCGGHACGVEDPAAAERYDIHARSLTPFSDYIVNLGLAYQLAQNVWLAAAYHTAPGNAIQ